MQPHIDDSETIGDILAEIGHHEEFHNATFSQDSVSESFEVPLNQNIVENFR